jgi:hypothetical protein
MGLLEWRKAPGSVKGGCVEIVSGEAVIFLEKEFFFLYIQA